MARYTADVTVVDNTTGAQWVTHRYDFDEPWQLGEFASVSVKSFDRAIHGEDEHG